MKKIILFCLIIYAEAFAQSGYTIELKKIYCDWHVPTSFIDSVETIIKDNNGNIIPPSNDYYYEYHPITNNNENTLGGRGMYKAQEDNDYNFIQTWYVIVTDVVNHTFTNLTSDTVSFQMETEPVRAKRINFQALRSNGSTEPGVRLEHWMYVVGLWNTNFLNYLTVNHYEVLRSSPGFLTANNDKFNHWNSDQSLVQNHKDFYFTNSTDSNLTANYKVSNGGITIQNNIDGFTGDSIEFKDPWLVDTTDSRFYESPYGYHNLGMSAPFIAEPSPFSPSLSSKYKGVFLNQKVNSGIYYSVRAPLTLTVNGSTAFFMGWSYSGASLQQVGPNPAGYDQKAVVFTSDGATVTANYSYSPINENLTIPSGTYNIAGDLTVSTGVTLTVNSGAVLNFQAGKGLVIKGKLVSNGAVFSSISGSWKGITLSHAEGSSIQNTTISYALSPIIIDTTSSITVSNCTINNSTFYDNNFNETAAIQVWHSTPTLNFITIEGQGNSRNGVRFADNSGGTLEHSTIEHLGYGNGVIVQGGSSPTINDNTVQNNYYHGIIVYYNGTGNPTITYNTVSYNGQNSYVGLYFANSTGTVRFNDVNHSRYGIWGRYASSITSGDVGQEGGNLITNNTYGIVATDNSNLDFGLSVPAKNYYWGVCNSIYGNTTYDAISESGAHLYAEYNWWGQYPLDPSKFYVDGTSRLDNNYPEQYSGDCPLSEPAASSYQVNNVVTPISPNENFASVIKFIREAKMQRDYSEAASLCRKLLSNTKALSYHKEVLSLLFSIFQASGDTSIVNYLDNYVASSSDFDVTANLLLASADAAIGKLPEAESIAGKLKRSYPNTDIGKQALFIVASLSSFNPAYKSKSAMAVKELIRKYGSSLDAGIIAALGSSMNNNFPKVSNKLSVQGSEKINTDTLRYSIGNYPNPFNPTTTISYQLPKGGYVTLKIYDMLGRKVKTLVSGMKDAGNYTAQFDGTNLASGIYIYRLEVRPSDGSSEFIAVKKLMLVK